MKDHRAVALDHAQWWAAYCIEAGTPINPDQIVAAARQFAAFLTEPTDVRLVVDQPTPTVKPTPRKRVT